MAEVRKRGPDFWDEFEFYLSDLVVGCVLDVVLVSLMAPTAALGARKPAAKSRAPPPHPTHLARMREETLHGDAEAGLRKASSTAALRRCDELHWLERSLLCASWTVRPPSLPLYPDCRWRMLCV